jgi:hypothetical protein
LWFVVGGARSLEFTDDGSSKEDTRIFKWFRPPEHNTPRPLVLYCVYDIVFKAIRRPKALDPLFTF